MKRFGAVLTTGALSLLLVFSASAAHAADEIGLAWDLSEDPTATLTRPVYENIRAVPGDSEARSFVVSNEADMAGELTAKIVNVRVTGDEHDQYYTDFTINSIPVEQLLGTSTTIAQQPLAAGEFTLLNFVYDLPEEAVSGNYPDGSEKAVSVSFDVELTLRGDTSTTTPLPSPSPSEPAIPGGSGGLPSTGAGFVFPVAAGALVLLAAGLGVRYLSRRRSATAH